VKDVGTRVADMDADKVHGTLRQMWRDWSTAGVDERATCYGPLLDSLDRCFSDRSPAEKAETEVLVPGCGLARLPWECAQRGYAAEGNEFTHFMLMAAYWLLRLDTDAIAAAESRGEGNVDGNTSSYELFPFAATTKNNAAAAHQLAKCTVPDVNPVRITGGGSLSMTSGDFRLVYGDSIATWDSVCSATVAM
jgi:carnosine N-methyltransferase